MVNVEALSRAGFVADDKQQAALKKQAVTNQMHETGPYVVHGVWRKGPVTLVVEQNTAAEEMGGGLSAVISHPPVGVLTGPNGSVACNPDDIDLILAMAAEVG